jgi:transposase InsO family protein
LLVWNTNTGWVEAFPFQAEMVQVVAKKLIAEFTPRLNLPISLGSNNGPAFTAKLSQLFSKALNINWKLHFIYDPWSSAKAERMNRTLKEIFN